MIHRDRSLEQSTLMQTYQTTRTRCLGQTSKLCTPPLLAERYSTVRVRPTVSFNIGSLAWPGDTFMLLLIPLLLLSAAILSPSFSGLILLQADLRWL